jgi:hypothetical protein
MAVCRLLAGSCEALRCAARQTTVRAIDVHEDDTVNEAALRALIAEAITLNTARAGKYVKFWKPGSDLSHHTGLCRRSGDDERSDILV